MCVYVHAIVGWHGVLDSACSTYVCMFPSGSTPRMPGCNHTIHTYIHILHYMYSYTICVNELECWLIDGLGEWGIHDDGQ